MSITLVEVPISLISLDEARFPDRDDRQILDHLVHYCSKFEPLPAVTIEVDGQSAIVVRGHKYLLAARALGRPSIRAVVTSPASAPDAAGWLARRDVRRLDWEQIRAIELADRTPRGWHVFFFDRALSTDEKLDFDDRVARLFSVVGGAGTIRVHHDDAKHLAEFAAPTPAADHAWATEHYATFAAFSRQRARIVSFQGSRFRDDRKSGS